MNHGLAPNLFQPFINPAANLNLPPFRAPEDQIQLLENFRISVGRLLRHLHPRERPNLEPLNYPAPNPWAKIDRDTHFLARMLHRLHHSASEALRTAKTEFAAYAAKMALEVQMPAHRVESEKLAFRIHVTEKVVKRIRGLHGRLKELHMEWKRIGAPANLVHVDQAMVQMPWVVQPPAAQNQTTGQSGFGGGRQGLANNWFIREGDISNGVRNPPRNNGKGRAGVTGSKGSGGAVQAEIPLPSFTLPKGVSWL